MIEVFSERLKELRREKDLTQLQFAKIFSVSGGTVAMWETGKREPNYETTMQLADFFNVSLDYLLGRTDLRDGYKIKTPAELADVGVVDVEKSGSGVLTPEEVNAIRAMLVRENSKG